MLERGDDPAKIQRVTGDSERKSGASPLIRIYSIARYTARQFALVLRDRFR